MTGELAKKEITSICEAVGVVIDRMPAGKQFSGYDLKNAVARIYPDCVNCYVDTVLRCARLKRRESFFVVSRHKSLYQKRG